MRWIVGPTINMVNISDAGDPGEHAVDMRTSARGFCWSGDFESNDK